MCACVGGECVHGGGEVWEMCACVSGECVHVCVEVCVCVQVCVCEVGGTMFLQSRGCGRPSLTGERGLEGS